MIDHIPTILVVDDDEFFRKIIIKILQNTPSFSNANFVQAENGLIAWETIEHNLPDAVILDLVMPVMDGKELTEKIKNKYPNLPILVLTGHDRPEIKQELIEKFEVESYLEKDVDHNQIIEELVRLIELNPINFI